MRRETDTWGTPWPAAKETRASRVFCQSRGWFFYWFGQPVKNMVDGVVAMVGVGVVEVVVVAMVVVVVVGMFAGVA